MKIVVIGVYFGSFPKNMPLWLKSCSYNPEIDFLVFTDQVLSDYPKNVRFIKMSLIDFSNLAARRLGIDGIHIKRPYKCCDFKPVYGIIFRNYIKGYDFWGHCDFDLVFGNILSNIDADAWDKYDKILPLGHLSFYRNTDEVNNRYKLESLTAGYKEVFLSDRSYAFDEFNGMMNIYERNGFPFYRKRVFADISSVYKRFRLSLNDKNYRKQVFYWEKGRVLKAYIKKGNIETSEYAYIHFKERKGLPMKISDIETCDAFYITRYGFIKKELLGSPTVHEIKQLNPYYGYLFERGEYYRFRFNNMIRKIRRFMNGVKK